MCVVCVGTLDPCEVCVCVCVCVYARACACEEAGRLVHGVCVCVCVCTLARVHVKKLVG